MCSIVQSASHATGDCDVLWRDENFTAYREKAHPVSSKGHIVVAFNLHVPSIYTLSSSDLPLLVNVRILATRLLASLLPPDENLFRIGFIAPPFRDNKIPVTDHLHCHAYIAPPDLMGWWRGIAYGPLAWYPVDDLIAEIRESVSNNRVKSGYENRPRAPIDMVPSAGARSGTADGTETSEPSIANTEADLEDGEGNTPARLVSPPRSPEAYTAPQSRTPSLRV
ncbi:hypothetical protein E4T56_gene3570 [Termitomyces sp. T112]|nr:hypothetical protein E4T56_gene3570 [Termitomyces sp. T112]